MKTSEKKFHHSFANPDETRPFQGHGKLELLNFEGGSSIGRGSFDPGWSWAKDVKPIAETESCQAAHTGYCVSGRMRIKMDSGEEFVIQEGEAFSFPAGHNAWVEGDRPCVLIDVAGVRRIREEEGKGCLIGGLTC